MRRVRSTFLLLSLLIGVQTFHILREPNSQNHQEITRAAILRATANVCKSTLLKEFKEPVKLNEEELATACKMQYKNNFEAGIKMICYHNAMVDLAHILSAQHHFDNEKFKEGKKLITDGMDKTINDMKNGKFDDARKALGRILHTLQDFYSHSNWIELKNTKPNSDLIDPVKGLTNLAGESEETCVEVCKKSSCGAQFRKDIKVLTSGYFELLPEKKPKGKCSHGGILDSTTGLGKSWDGINKDYKEHNNGHGDLHNTASNLAIDATVQLLENIWKKTDNKKFLGLVGLHDEEPAGVWRTYLNFISFKSRYPDANKPDEIGKM